MRQRASSVDSDRAAGTAERPYLHGPHGEDSDSFSPPSVGPSSPRSTPSVPATPIPAVCIADLAAPFNKRWSQAQNTDGMTLSLIQLAASVAAQSARALVSNSSFRRTPYVQGGSVHAEEPASIASSSSTLEQSNRSEQVGLYLLELLALLEFRVPGWLKWTRVRRLLREDDPRYCQLPDHVWCPPELIAAIVACFCAQAAGVRTPEVICAWLDRAAADPRAETCRALDVDGAAADDLRVLTPLWCEREGDVVVLADLPIQLSYDCVTAVKRMAAGTTFARHHPNIAIVLGAAAIGDRFVIGGRLPPSNSPSPRRRALTELMDTNYGIWPEGRPFGGGVLGWRDFLLIGAGVAKALQFAGAEGNCGWCLSPDTIIMNGEMPILVARAASQSPLNDVRSFGQLLQTLLTCRSGGFEKGLPEELRAVIDRCLHFNAEGTPTDQLHLMREMRIVLNSHSSETRMLDQECFEKFLLTCDETFQGLLQSPVGEDIEFEQLFDEAMNLARELSAWESKTSDTRVAVEVERKRQTMLQVARSLNGNTIASTDLEKTLLSTSNTTISSMTHDKRTSEQGH